MEIEETNRILLDFFDKAGLTKVSSVMRSELLKSKKNWKQQPRLHALIMSKSSRSRKQLNLEKEYKTEKLKINSLLYSGKQVFSVAHNLISLVNSLRSSIGQQNVEETVDGFKRQLVKYHRVLQLQGKPQGEQPTQVVMIQHKQRLDRYWQQRNLQGITQIFLSLRVNALQISPQLRKNLVYQLIRNDLFKIEDSKKLDFLISLFDIDNASLRSAVLAIVSIVASTLRGVDYITQEGNNTSIIDKVFKLCKDQPLGSVFQRFCIALLQKCSIKQKLIPTYLKHNLIQWVLGLLKKSLSSSIHHFILDFGSAIMANVIHTPYALTQLSKTPQIAQKLIQSFLKLIKEKIPVSVLMHILICLSYLSKDHFKAQLQRARFVQRISQFVEVYSQINTSQNQAAQIDKRTVLDLCAYMFHPKDATFENSQTMQLNQLKTEDRIRQYENEQGQLIFQCFQDQM